MNPYWLPRCDGEKRGPEGKEEFAKAGNYKSSRDGDKNHGRKKRRRREKEVRRCDVNGNQSGHHCSPRVAAVPKGRYAMCWGRMYPLRSGPARYRMSIRIQTIFF